MARIGWRIFCISWEFNPAPFDPYMGRFAREQVTEKNIRVTILYYIRFYWAASVTPLEIV